MDLHQPLTLNVLTAGPILRLLVAALGYENDDIPFPEGWAAFKNFLAFPTVIGDDGGTFQVCPAEEDPLVFDVFIGRQLSERRRSQLSEVDYEDTRIVGINFVLEAPDPVDELEVWSKDFPDLSTFFGHVENTSAFHAALSAQLAIATFYSQEI